MDKQDTLRNLAISAAVFLTVLWFWPKLVPPPPRQPTAPPTADWTTGTDGQTIEGDVPHEPAATPGGVVGQPAVSPLQPQAPQDRGGFVVVEADAVQTPVMGSAVTNGTSEEELHSPYRMRLTLSEEELHSPYRMRLTLSNVGAAIESATITDHAEDLGSPARYRLLSPIERDDIIRYRSLAVEQINVDGVDLSLHAKKWHAEPVRPSKVGTKEGQAVAFWIEIHKNGAPALKLTRTFSLPRQEKGLGRHDLKSDITVENLSDEPHRVVVAYRGGLGIRQASSRVDDRYLDWGVHDGTRAVGARKQQAALTGNAGQVIPLYVPSAAAPDARLSWAAAANTYFTCTTAPLNRDGTDNARYIAKVSGVDLDGSSFTDDDAALRFVTRAETVSAGQTLSYPAAIYLGEKDPDTFREVDEYRSRNYYYQVSQGYGWCTFTWLVELMLRLLNGLFWVVRDFGVAIIILVLIVRALLHPITKKGQINMVRMQQRMGEFTPKIEELKKRFGNDKARLQQETMKLYREHGVNPATQFLGCLPMAIQMPIWVALWISLSNNILMRHQPFHFTWVHDLTAPDALIPFSSPIIVPFFGWELPAFNLLPILLSISMYAQMKLQPKPKPNPSMSDQQRQQQQMMQKMGPMMSIMMLFLFYKAPSGLNIYIMFSSLFGAFEQWRIRKHIKDREAAGTLAKADQSKGAQPGQRRKSGKPSFIERMQRAAEEAHKTQAQRSPKSRSRR